MPDRKARLGFIGAGWWATANHMPLFVERDDVELVAVCRLGQQELREVKERFGFQFATEDYRELLETQELDGVVVASPHTLHAEHAVAALERGLHVMCEKPMTTRAADARRIVQLADEKGVHLVVPYGWHYQPFIIEAKRQLQQGVIGSIEYAQCHMASPIRSLLVGDFTPAELAGGQAGEAAFAPAASTWADPQIAGGGYGHAQITHSSGLLFWLSELQPKEVFALMAAPGSRVELYDALSVRFQGGAVGSFSGAGTIPPDNAFQLDIRLFGSEGMLLLDVERERMEIRRNDKQDVVLDVPSGEGDYTCDGPPNTFIDLILGKPAENRSPGWTALRSVELLDAAYRSSVSGRMEQV